MPILRSVSGPATFEDADAMWLDPRSVLVGRGLRTNDAGANQVRATLAEQEVEVIQVDLPYGTMHLMGMLRIVDRDRAIVARASARLQRRFSGGSARPSIMLVRRTPPYNGWYITSAS